MRWFMFLPLLLVLASAAEISAPAELNVTDNITIPVSVYSGFPGTRVVAQWDNPKLDIFPGEYWMKSENQALTYYLFLQPGLCGSTNLTFSLGEARASTHLDFGTCVPLYQSIPTMTPFERNFYDLKIKKIDIARRYLQVTPDIQARIDEIEGMIRATLAEPDFTRKDILAAQTKAKITELDQVFPYTNDMGEKVEQIGTVNMTGKLQAQFGEIEPALSLYYKRRVDTQVMAPGSTRNFTLYKLIFYNPSVDNSTQFFVAEDFSPTVTDTTPYYNSSFVVWDLTLKPKEIKTIMYGSYEKVDRPITTFTFRKAVVQQPQQTEPEVEEQPPAEEPEPQISETIPDENQTQPQLPTQNQTQPPQNTTQALNSKLLIDNLFGFFQLFYKLITGANK